MIVSRLDADGKLALPAELLDALGIRPGDEVGFYDQGGQMVIFRNPLDDEVDEELGMTYGEVRGMLAETENEPTYPAEEVFERVLTHIDELARKSNAA